MLSVLNKFNLLILSLCVLSACTVNKDVAQNNGEGFGGGDPFAGKLQSLRNDLLLPAARGIASGSDVMGLCDVSKCPSNEPLCTNLPPLSAAQVSYCESTLLQLSSHLVDSLSNSDITLVGKGSELFVQGTSVTARTQFSLTGAIEVSYPRYQQLGLDDNQLAAILVHEFLHKVEFQAVGNFIQDNPAYGPFSGQGGGSQLLNALGVMVVSYALRNQDLNASLSFKAGSLFDFGAVPENGSEPQSFTIENIGDKPATQIVVQPLSDPYSVNPAGCSDTLAVSESCEIEVTFSPTDISVHGTNLLISYFDGTQTRSLSILLNGKGAKPTLLAAVGTTITPLDINGNIQNGEFASFAAPQDVRIASGDVNNDGYPDIIVGAGEGDKIPPLVRVFSGKTGMLIHERLAYSEDFYGGVFVASADFNGDGYADVVTGAGNGGGSHINVFDGKTGLQTTLSTFFAFDGASGARVAAGDMDGDGIIEIAAGTGPGLEPLIRIFDLAGNQLAEEPAYNPLATVGILLSMGNTDSDSKAELIVTPALHGTHVRVFELVQGVDGKELQINAGQDFFHDPAPEETQGARAGAIDFDNDGIDEIVTQSGLTSQIRIWKPSVSLGTPIEEFQLTRPVTLTTIFR